MQKPWQWALHWQIALGMLIGAAAGLALKVGWGSRTTVLTRSEVPGLPFQSAAFSDTTDGIRIELVLPDGGTRRWEVVGLARRPYHLPSLQALKERDAEAYAWFVSHGRSVARRWGDASRRLGSLFLRLLKMVSVPLIITSLATGIMGMGQARRLGRMFARTLVYYLSTSLLAIIVGLAMVNLVRPGIRTEATVAAAASQAPSPALSEVLFGQLEALIPPNPIEAVAETRFLSIIAFTIVFSVFTILVGGGVADRLRQLFADLFEVMMALTLAVIRLAPIGVLFLMLYVTATQGGSIFRSLAWYMVTVAAGLCFHATITLPLVLRFVARRDPLAYAKALSPALLTAFSSASSNGTLPLTLTCVEEGAGISNRVSSFVLPLGATINMDGTALYEAVAVLFIAQLYHGGNLPLVQQVIVAVTALLASIGAAGIPHAGLVMMTIILQAVGLPVEMQGVILAVDRLLDMCRTSVNVWSDACGCAVVARFEAAGQPAAAGASTG